METKTTKENLSNTIKIIRNNQKAQFTKVIDFEAKLKALCELIGRRLDRIEIWFDKEKDETDRFDNVIDRLTIWDKYLMLILTV